MRRELLGRTSRDRCHDAAPVVFWTPLTPTGGGATPGQHQARSREDATASQKEDATTFRKIEANGGGSAPRGPRAGRPLPRNRPLRRSIEFLPERGEIQRS